MGLIFGLIKRLIKLSFFSALFILVIAFIPNLPPYSNFTSIELEPTLPSVGPLERNEVLNNAEKLYNEKLVGPEAFQVYNGEVYTSTGTGDILKLSPGGHVTFVTKIGKPCQGLHQTHICGRPLGFEIDAKKGEMYVADAYYGIWKVNLKTDKRQLLVSPNVEIEGRKPMLFNHLALAKNGDFYWTDSSSEFPLHDGAKTALTDPSGRLFYYNAAKNQSKVLLDELWFANGVAISPDGQFVVVSESNRYRLIKYYIDGPKKGKSEVFIAGLPGVPDNLRALPDGSGLQITLYLTFDEENPLLSKSLAKTPIVRKFLARLMTLVEMPFEFLNKHFPNVIFEEIVHSIGSFQSLSAFVPHTSALLVVDWNGKLVASYHNTDESLAHVSDAVVYRDQLYTGSPHGQNYVGAVPAPALLKKAYASVQNTPPPKTAETVTEKIPKAAEPKKKEAPKVEKVKPSEPAKVTKPVEKSPPPPPPSKEKRSEPEKAKTPPPPTTTPPPKKAPTTTPPPKTAPTTTPPPKTAPTTTPPPKTAPTTPPPKTAPTTTPPPKTAPTTTPMPKTTSPPKQAEVKQKVKTENSESKKKQKKVSTESAKEEIPIIEEIPSDTAKPTNEKLKVIKKGGPTEIPNPNL